MTDWDACTRAGTWGGFIAYSRAFGVTIEELPDVPFTDGVTKNVPYLLRLVDGHPLTYVLPKDCTPDRRMGFMRYAHVCLKLRIPEPKWPVVL